MPTKPKLRFSIATHLWLMVCVAVFFGGRWSMRPELERQKAKQQAEVAVLQMEKEQVTAIMRSLGNALSKAKKGVVVVDVSDGETVSSVHDKKLTRVQVDGIDCPESDQAWGREATWFTTDFCMQRNVELIGDKTDADGARLADVIVNGKSLREALLEAGLAWHDTRTNNDPELAKPKPQSSASGRIMGCAAVRVEGVVEICQEATQPTVLRVIK